MVTCMMIHVQIVYVFVSERERERERENSNACTLNKDHAESDPLIHN